MISNIRLLTSIQFQIWLPLHYLSALLRVNMRDTISRFSAGSLTILDKYPVVSMHETKEYSLAIWFQHRSTIIVDQISPLGQHTQVFTELLGFIGVTWLQFQFDSPNTLNFDLLSIDALWLFLLTFRWTVDGLPMWQNKPHIRIRRPDIASNWCHISTKPPKIIKKCWCSIQLASLRNNPSTI